MESTPGRVETDGSNKIKRNQVTPDDRQFCSDEKMGGRGMIRKNKNKVFYKDDGMGAAQPELLQGKTPG